MVLTRFEVIMTIIKAQTPFNCHFLQGGTTAERLIRNPLF